jgi:hypothetical protein
MDAHDYNKWMGMPKFKAWIVDLDSQPKMIQIRFGHLQSENDFVNVCFQIPENVENLAIQLQDAMNTCLKSFYIPQNKGIDYAIEERNVSSNNW